MHILIHNKQNGKAKQKCLMILHSLWSLEYSLLIHRGLFTNYGGMGGWENAENGWQRGEGGLDPSPS